MDDLLTLRDIAEMTHCSEDAVAAWIKRYSDAPECAGQVRTPSGRMANTYPRAAIIQFLHRHHKIPLPEQQDAANGSDDAHLSLYQLAERFKLPYKKLRKLHHYRSDCPPALYKRKDPENYHYGPVFSLKQFAAYLRELGLIPRTDPSKVTLNEAAKLIGLSRRQIYKLHQHDQQFPAKTGGKLFNKGIGHFEFDREEMLRYGKHRQNTRGVNLLNVKPIELSGDLKNNVVQFLAMPSGRRQRVTPSGSAKTVRIRTEGVVGIW